MLDNREDVRLWRQAMEHLYGADWLDELSLQSGGRAAQRAVASGPAASAEQGADRSAVPAAAAAAGCCVCVGLGQISGPLGGWVVGAGGARQIPPAPPVGWVVALTGGQGQIMNKCVLNTEFNESSNNGHDLHPIWLWLAVSCFSFASLWLDWAWFGNLGCLGFLKFEN